MTDSPEFVDLIERLRAFGHGEYRRGLNDATRRIIEAAQAEANPTPAAQTQAPLQAAVAHVAAMTAEELHEAIRLRHRAPPGAPDALIRRVLSARFPAGASSMEIHRMAESDAEKMVSLSGVRFALDRGRDAGKYRNANGEWFLTEEPKN